MRFPPETRYARSGDLHIAYQTVGNGPIDLVFVMGWVSHLDYFWTEPRFAHFLTRLASFSRLILFDKRGTGLSDRVAGIPNLEERADDVRAVMDAVGSKRAALLGVSEGAVLCAQFAAMHPDRTSALIMIGGYPRRLEAPDYPWGIERAARLSFIDEIEEHWGTDSDIDRRAPSLTEDARFMEWWSTYLRMSASPGAAAALARMNMEIDIRQILPAIRVPALIVHRAGDQEIRVEHGRYLAAHIPGARYVELPGDDHLPFVGNQDEVLREIELFLTGELPHAEPDRVLATVLTTGIVEGAAIAARLGERAWTELATAHTSLVREEFVRFRGQEIRTSFGSFMASFDGPARAIRCARSIVQRSLELGIIVRAGLHAGECEITNGELSGSVLQMAERILSRAGSGDIFVSSTIRDLVAGSGIEFADLPDTLLTGPDRSLPLYLVASDAAPQLSPASIAPAEDLARAPATLTSREREIAILVARGHTNREVAELLSIAPTTADRHVANILAKLGYHSRAQIAAWAVANDLLRIDPN